MRNFLPILLHGDGSSGRSAISLVIGITTFILVILGVLHFGPVLLKPHPASVKEAPSPTSEPAASTSGPNNRPAVSPSQPPAKDAPAKDGIETVLTIPWGSGPGELGRKFPQEGNPEGPMSFAVDSSGRLLVLDQVNSRIQVFENGKFLLSIAIPSDTFQDIAVDEDGDIAALDRLARKSIAFIDASGRFNHEMPFEGRGVAEGGSVTAMFYRDDGVWVEVGHERLVRVSDRLGRVDPARPSAQGRFSGDGQYYLTASLEGREAAVVQARRIDDPAGGTVTLARVKFQMKIMNLLTLESDSEGRIYLVAALFRERETEPFDVVEQAVTLVVIGPDGKEIGRIVFPSYAGPEEQFRPFILGPDGAIYQLGLGPGGVTLRRYNQ